MKNYPARSLLLLMLLTIDVEGKPFYSHHPAVPSSHLIQFTKIKDLIDRINIKEFRRIYNVMEHALEEEDDLVEIDLTDEAIMEDRVIADAEAETVTNEEPTTAAAPAAVEEPTTAAAAAVEEPTTAAAAAKEANTAAAVEDASTVAAAVEEASTADAVEETTAAASVAEITTISNNKALEEATTATAIQATVVTGEADMIFPEADETENEIVDEFFVSEETLSAAKKFGYKILLKKVNGENIPVGKIKFSFPTYIEIEAHEPVTEAATAAAAKEATTQAATKETEVEVTTKAAAPEAEVTTGADASEADVTTEVIAKAAVTTAIIEEATTTAASADETTTALAIVTPAVTAAVIPEITEISSETVNQGADQVVEDAERAIDALKGTKETVEISADCSVPLEEIKSLVVNLARNVKSSTPILTEILAIGKSLSSINDTATLLRNGGELLKLLEPFLESILPSTEVNSCGIGSSNGMLLSLSNVASEVDIVANTVENVENGKSSALHEAATSLQLAAWILAQLQQSVHTFYYKRGICNGQENGSTTAILKSLATAMESYAPMVAMLGPESGVVELEDTVEAINKAVGVLESLRPDQHAGLPGVSCTASLAEMGHSLEKLADFVNNLSTI